MAIVSGCSLSGNLVCNYCDYDPRKRVYVLFVCHNISRAKEIAQYFQQGIVPIDHIIF